MLGSQLVNGLHPYLGSHEMCGLQPPNGSHTLLGLQHVVGSQFFAGLQLSLGSQSLSGLHTSIGSQSFAGLHLDLGSHSPHRAPSFSGLGGERRGWRGFDVGGPELGPPSPLSPPPSARAHQLAPILNGCDVVVTVQAHSLGCQGPRHARRTIRMGSKTFPA
jgi:hypothetical protein